MGRSGGLRQTPSAQHASPHSATLLRPTPHLQLLPHALILGRIAVDLWQRAGAGSVQVLWGSRGGWRGPAVRQAGRRRCTWLRVSALLGAVPAP